MVRVRSCGHWYLVSLAATCLFGALVESAAAQTPIPQSPWVAQDIGSPALAGSASLSSGIFRIDAAGSDIWGSSDQFQFVYQPIAGDVDIAARIDSLTVADGWSKAGVMIRKSLSPGSAHAMAVVTGSFGTAFQRRLADGGSSAHTAGPAGAAPRWVRLVRAGTRVTAYTSPDGTAWTTIGSDTISLGTTAYVGLAVTSHNVSVRTTAFVSHVTATPKGLPAGQKAQDIGSPAIAGSTSYQNGTYTVKAAGADIWDTADQFHFVWQPVTGDVDVVARVASIGATSGWAKAGVMVRESLTAGSRHASALLSQSNGYAFQRRLTTDGLSSHTGGALTAFPGWVRLVRKGTRFDAYQSATGTSWTLIGSDDVTMADSVYVGIAVTSHNTTAATTAVLDSFKVTAATTTNQPPSVTLTAPASASSFAEPATIALAATASDPDGAVSRVDFFHDGALVGSDTTSPYSASWTGVAAGTYTLTAVAYDGSGASTTSNAATITVTSATNKPPTVALTAPANATTYAAPASVVLTASASDPEGKLARVEFYAGTTLLATDTASPYTFTWGSVPAGTYQLKAVAYDTAGASAASAIVSITVTGTTTTAPTAVSFTASTDQATVTSYRLDVFASGVNTATATPVATSDLGKPTPDSTNTITVNRATWFSALAAGTYQATVTAISPSGSGRSAAVTFTR
jgi:Big-like domain-containing protein